MSLGFNMSTNIYTCYLSTDPLLGDDCLLLRMFGSYSLDFNNNVSFSLHLRYSGESCDCWVNSQLKYDILSWNVSFIALVRLCMHPIMIESCKVYPTILGWCVKWNEMESMLKFMKLKGLYGKSMSEHTIATWTHNFVAILEGHLCWYVWASIHYFVTSHYCSWTWLCAKVC